MELISVVNSLVITVSDWIQIGGIAITAGLSIWIVNTIQAKVDSKRFIKEFFINEILEIRNEYRVLIGQLKNGELKPRMVKYKTKELNIRVNDLMSILKEQYNINFNYLLSYQLELLSIVMDSREFITNFTSNSTFSLSEQTLGDLSVFENENDGKFSKLIMEVNKFE